MSFAEGFAKVFAPTMGMIAQEMIKADFEAEKTFLSDWKTAQNEFDKLRLKDNELRDTAKQLVGSLPGVPPDAWVNVYQDLKMKRPLESIRDDLLNSDFVRRDSSFAPTSTPQAPSMDAQMLDAGIVDTATPDAPARTFKFTRSGTERAMERVREETGLTDTQIADVRAGRYTPEQVTPSLMVAPRNKGSKLTQSDVAGAYMDAARKGPEALSEFKANTLPNMMAALDAAGAGPQSTTDLSRALGNLERARASGDPAQIKRAEEDVNRLIQAEEMKKSAGEAGKPKRFVVTGEDGTTRFVSGTSRITANGREILDSSGQRLTGNVREVTDAENSDASEVIKANTSEINKYQNDLANTSGALRLSGELIDLARSDPRALTRVAGGVKNIQGLLREANSFTSVLNDVIKDNGGQPVTLQQFEQGARNRGILQPGQTLEQFASRNIGNLTMGATAENLASTRSLLESKLYLMAFRAGGLEGQSGNAMSNKDFERITSIIQASSNPQTFERGLTDYMRGRVQALDDRAVQLNNTPLVQRFRTQYGYSPVEEMVTPVQKFVDGRNDPQLQQSFGTVMGRAQATQGQGNQPQNKAPAPQVPGYTFQFFSPESGKPVYADKNGNLFEGN